MKTIFKQNENAFNHHYTLSDPIWTELGIQLNRPPRLIFDHWEVFIQPKILKFESKMEIEDIRRILIDYFVEKGIKFRSEINWGEVIKDERFKGTTPAVLSSKLRQIVYSVRKANPDIEVHDITIEVLHQYLDERARKHYMDKRSSKLIEDYMNIKNSM